MKSLIIIAAILCFLTPKQLLSYNDESLPIQAYRLAIETVNTAEQSQIQPFTYTQTIEDDKGNRLVRRFDSTATDDQALVLETRGEDLSELQIDWSVPLLLDVGTFADLQPDYCEEDANHWVFCSLAPVAVDLDNAEQTQNANQLAQENLRSKIWITKEEPHVSKMTIFNTEAFRPSPLARVDRFEIALEFKRAWPNGPMITSKASRRLKGKYGFFISLDEYLEQHIDDITPYDQ